MHDTLYVVRNISEPIIHIVRDTVKSNPYISNSIIAPKDILAPIIGGLAGAIAGYFVGWKQNSDNKEKSRISVRAELDIHSRSIESKVNQVIVKQNINADDLLDILRLISSLTDEIYSSYKKDIFSLGYEFSGNINIYYTEIKNLKVRMKNDAFIQTHLKENFISALSISRLLDQMLISQTSWPKNLYVRMKFGESDSSRTKKINWLQSIINNEDAKSLSEYDVLGPSYELKAPMPKLNIANINDEESEA